MDEKILEIKKLYVDAEGFLGDKLGLIHNISTSFNEGKITGIVGESGSGKSMLMKAVMDLLPENVSMKYASMIFDGKDLGQYDKSPMAMIFQDPTTSLNPLRTVAFHLEEVISRHQDINKEDTHDLMLSQLDKVGIRNPERVLKLFPHELSGGMIQRIMISMAILKKPRLLIADEPTTALDVTIQAQILDIIRELNQKEGLTVIFVSHDMGVISDLCHEVKVMFDGKILEEAGTDDLFNNPRHRYTQELLKAIPSGKNKERLYEMDAFKLTDEEKFYGRMEDLGQGHSLLVGGKIE